MSKQTHWCHGMEKYRAERDRAVAALESLHKRIRGLAVDLGATLTDDPVEDVRRAVEGMREVCEAAGKLTPLFKQWLVARGMEHYHLLSRIVIVAEEVKDAARRLAAVRKGE